MPSDSYYVVACKILHYLYKCLRDGTLPNPNILKAQNYKINENYFNNVIYMLYKNGYIERINCMFEYNQTHPIVEIDERIRITQQGIEFLEDNNLMQRALNKIKEIKDIIPGM